MKSPDDADKAREAVLAEIASAFDGVTREDGVTLHEAEVIDGYGSDEERAAARKLDTDASWHDVEESDIERHHDILSFLDAKGLRYYLPAYMTWALRHFKESDSLSTVWTIYAAARPREQRFRTFDLAQMKAVKSFLEYMARYGGGRVDYRAALHGVVCWTSFLEARS